MKLFSRVLIFLSTINPLIINTYPWWPPWTYRL